MNIGLERRNCGVNSSGRVEERRSGGQGEWVGRKSSSRMKLRGGLAKEGFECIANVGGLAN